MEFTQGVGANAKLVDMLRDVSLDQKEQILLDFVAAEVAIVLETTPDAPPSQEAGLFELGMDSLMSVELKRRLERGFGAPRERAHTEVPASRRRLIDGDRPPGGRGG